MLQGTFCMRFGRQKWSSSIQIFLMLKRLAWVRRVIGPHVVAGLQAHLWRWGGSSSSSSSHQVSHTSFPKSWPRSMLSSMTKGISFSSRSVASLELGIQREWEADMDLQVRVCSSLDCMCLSSPLMSVFPSQLLALLTSSLSIDATSSWVYLISSRHCMRPNLQN